MLPHQALYNQYNSITDQALGPASGWTLGTDTVGVETVRGEDTGAGFGLRNLQC